MSKIWPMPALLRIAKMRWKRGRLFASQKDSEAPPVPPPPSGSLPFGDGPISGKENTYQVFFFLDGTYSGYEGALMMDSQTVITAGVVADAISSTPGTWTARMGGVLVSGADADQTILVTGPFIFDPSYAGFGAYDTDLATVFCGAPFTTNSFVAPIEYSQNVSEPYSEYFYPVGQTVATSGMIEWFFGTPTTSDLVGSYVNVISNSDAGSILSESMPAASISTDNFGIYYAGFGAPLIAAGYGTYFLIGHLVRQDTGPVGVLVFNRYSEKTGTIISISGINPIIYP